MSGTVSRVKVSGSSSHFSRLLCCWFGIQIALLLLGQRAAGQMTVRGRIDKDQNKHVFTEKEILDMLLDGYDNKLRPKTNVNGTAEATVVRVNLLVRSISRIDDLNMEYSTQLTLRQEWNDNRLAYDDGGLHKYLVLPDIDKVWRPDLFFQNEKHGHLHHMLVPNCLLRIHPNGDIMLSIRLSLTLACPMDLRFFPMDRQVCEVRIASYGHTSDDIELFWKAINHPIQLANISMPRFRLEGVKSQYCSSVTATGSYSCLRVMLFLTRELSSYVARVYVPTTLFIIMSWVCFWLHPDAAMVRVTLGVLMLLMTATTLSGVNNQLPAVSYTTAFEVWSSVCLSFLFAALLESVLVNHISQLDTKRQRKQLLANQRKQWRSQVPQVYGKELAAGGTDGHHPSFAMRPLLADQHQSGPLDTGINPNGGFGCRQNYTDYLQEAIAEISLEDGQEGNQIARPSSRKGFGGLRIPMKRAKKIDFFCRLIFPFSFLLFNILYWSIYLGNVSAWPV